jgi:sulfur carrier protein ThiS
VSVINLFKSANDNNYITIDIKEKKTIREVLPDLDFDNSIIAVNGNLVNENHILCDDDICTIRLFPKGSVLLGGIVVLGFIFMANKAVEQFTGKSLIQHIGNALRKWLFPDDGANNHDRSVENIPQLRGARNQSNRNRPIPLVLGKHLYTPMYIGAPYSTIEGVDGEDQYYNVLYLLGWGKLKVSDIRLGPVSGLSRNIAGRLDGMLPYNDAPDFADPSFAASNPLLELRHAGEVGLYPQRVVEERLGIELLNAAGDSLEVIRFSAKNPQRVQVEFTFNNGLFSYNDKNELVNASVDIRLEWRGGSSGAWQEFGRIGTSGGQSPTTYNSTLRTTTITRQKQKQMRFIAERSFTFEQVKAAVNRTIQLRILRTNPQPVDNRTADSVFLSAIRTWCFDYSLTDANGLPDNAPNKLVPQRPIVEKYRDQTARLGFRIKATDNLQGTIDALNCMVQSYARTWDGSNWSDTEEPTNNPASIALKVLQSPALGNNSYPNYMLDLDSFGEFYEWCEDREYTCNGVLVNEKRVDELLNAVLSTGRGMRILNETRYGVLIDKPRTNPVMVLNNQNVLEATNQKNFEDLPDGFSVKFINELDGYLETEVFVMADGSAKPKPRSRIEAIEMPFITDYKQIIKNAWYMLACRHLRPEIWRRKLSIDGYLVGIGSLVEVQDDTIAVGIGEGAEIKGIKIENNIITEIQTDGVFDVVDTTKQYGIKIMQFNGIHPGKARTVPVKIPEAGIYSNFTVSISVYDLPTPNIGDIISFGEYNKITTPAICFGKKNNGDGTFDVTLIPYQEGIYTTDSGPIPPYEVNITRPQGLVPVNTIPPDTLSLNQIFETARDFAGRDGDPGQNAIYLHLDNENHAIACNSDGVPIGGSLGFVVQATVYDGIMAVAGTDVVWNIFPNNINISINNSGVITVPVNAILEDTTLITVIAIYRQESFTRTLTLVKVRAGAYGLDGEDAVVFSIQPVPSIIRRNQQGINDPSVVTCNQFIHVGNQISVSHERLMFRTSLMAAEATYPTGGVNIGTATWVDFILYHGSGMILDRQRVPVLQDGRDGQDGAPGRGIVSIEYKFRVTNSPAAPTQPWADAGWLTSAPATSDTNRWLWFIERITYNIAPLTQDTIGLQAVHGQAGAAGELVYIETPVSIHQGNGTPEDWGRYTPSSIVLRSLRRIGSTAPVSQMMRYVIEETEDGVNWYSKFTPADASTVVYSPGRYGALQGDDAGNRMGWSTNAPIVWDDKEGMFCVETVRQGTSVAQFNINTTAPHVPIRDNEIWCVEFGIKANNPNAPANLGQFFGLNNAAGTAPVQISTYNLGEGTWGAWSGASSNQYFIDDVRNTDNEVLWISAYVCGVGVQLTDLPDPVIADTYRLNGGNNTQLVRAFRLVTPHENEKFFRFRTGANPGNATTPEIRVRIFKPRIYRVNPPIAIRARVFPADTTNYSIDPIDTKIITIATDGESGLNPVYLYSAGDTQPGITNGEFPAGWTTTFPATGTVWQATGFKNGYGILVGDWIVGRYTGLRGERGNDGNNGIGINNIPHDAWAFYSCDETPLIPDNDGTVMREEVVYRAEPSWAGWTGNGLSVSGGILTWNSSGSNAISVNIPLAVGDVVRVRARLLTGNVNTGLLLNTSSGSVSGGNFNALNTWVNFTYTPTFPFNVTIASVWRPGPTENFSLQIELFTVIRRVNSVIRRFEYLRATAADMIGGHLVTNSLENGSLKSIPTGFSPNWHFTSAASNGRIIIARIRYDRPVGVPLVEHGATNQWRPMKVLRQFSDREYLVYDVLDLAPRNLVWIGMVGGESATGWLEAFYIGDASFITPLLDNSGNKRHIPLTGGVIASEGRWGQGLMFLGGAAALPVEHLFNPAGSFTWSLWINKNTIGRIQYIIGNWENGGGGLVIDANGDLRVSFFSNNAYHAATIPVARVPNNVWLHVLLEYNSTSRVFTIRINNVLDTARVTLPAQITWANMTAPLIPLTLGANPDRLNGNLIFTNPFQGLMDEVIIFTRLLSDDEKEALYLATPQSRYTLSNWQLDPMNPVNAMQQAPRYRGATNTAGNNTGIISTTQGGDLRLNHLDWVLFTGTAGWTTSFLYEWNAITRLWARVERNGNWERYLDAVSDITTGAPEGVFSTAFIQNLFVQTLNNVYAYIRLRLKVGTDNDAIEIDGQNSWIRSANYRSGEEGFIIRKEKVNGIQAEFTDVRAVNMEATNMRAQDSFFEGNLIAGGAFNENGGFANANLGGIIANQRNINERHHTQINRLRVRSELQIGQDHGFGTYGVESILVNCAAARFNKRLSYSYFYQENMTENSRHNRAIRGSMNFTTLSGRIDTMVGGVTHRPTSVGTRIVASGSINIATWQGAPSWAGFCIITSVSWSTNHWRLFGQRVSNGDLVEIPLNATLGTSTLPIVNLVF